MDESYNSNIQNCSVDPFSKPISNLEDDVGGYTHSVLTSIYSIIYGSSNPTIINDEIESIDIEDFTSQAQSMVDNLANGGTLKKYTNMIRDAGNTLKNAVSGKTVEIVVKNIRLVFVIIGVFIIACAILYGLSFIFECFPLKCVLCCHWNLNCILLLLLLIICIFVSILFELFYIFCPLLPYYLEDFSDEVMQLMGMENPNFSFYDVFTCPGPEKRIFYLMDLFQKFNGNSLVKEYLEPDFPSVDIDPNMTEPLREVIAMDSNDPFGEGYLDSNYNQVHEGLPNNFSEIFIQGLCGYNSSEQQNMEIKINESLTLLPKDELKNMSIGFESFQDAVNDTYRNIQIIQMFDKTLLSHISISLDAIVHDISENISCDYFCAIYIPLVNTFCGSLLSGSAYWIFSSIIFLIAAPFLSIFLTCRQSQLKDKRKNDYNEESISDDADIYTSSIFSESDLIQEISSSVDEYSESKKKDD